MENINSLRNNILLMCVIAFIDMVIQIRVSVMFSYLNPYTSMGFLFLAISLMSCLFMPYLLVEQLYNIYRLQKGLRLRPYFSKRVKWVAKLRWIKYIVPLIFIGMRVLILYGPMGIISLIGTVFGTINILSVPMVLDVLSLFIYKKLERNILAGIEKYHATLGGNNGKT